MTTKFSSTTLRAAALALACLLPVSALTLAWLHSRSALVAAVAPPAVPAVHRHIYPEISEADADVATGLQEAAAQHKRVILIFGGDWCGDCQVLDINLHDSASADLLARNYIVVHVNIGHMDQNVALAAKYGVPLKKGVPAVSVVDADGNVIHAQATGEFANMRHMDPRTVNAFLNQWKA